MNDAEKWLKRLVGEKYVEAREESKAMDSWQYGDPANVLERKQGIRKAQEKKVKKGEKR